MTPEDLKRVCDDAERWNALHALSDPTGYEAIKKVREWRDDCIDVVSTVNIGNIIDSYMSREEVLACSFRVPKFYELKDEKRTPH